MQIWTDIYKYIENFENYGSHWELTAFSLSALLYLLFRDNKCVDK